MIFRLLIFFLYLVFSNDILAINNSAILTDQPPRALSEYEFFVDPMNQLPSEEVIPYELITALFSDYADKDRFVYIPKGKMADFNDDNVFDFPIGAALIKTFSYAQEDGSKLLLETRLLLNKETGWDALTYVWNADDKDAYLALGGKTIDVYDAITPSSSSYIRYRVPNKNQCKECHLKNDLVQPIGPKPRNLNKIIMSHGNQVNQLKDWALNGLIPENNYSNNSIVNAFNSSNDIDDRARAYLDINCGHCHTPDGSASSSGLYLSIDDNDIGIYKKPVAAGRGSGGVSYSIVPGKPEESILLFRMLSNEPDIMMPESGRSLMHDEAISLIQKWISEMQ